MERSGSEPWAWLQPVGTVSEPLDRDWRRVNTELLGAVWSTPRPAHVRVGDLIVYYASGWQRAVGIVEVTGRPTGGDGGRWQWKLPICPLVLLDMDHAPDPADVDVEWNRKLRRLWPEEYARLRAAMLAAAAPLAAAAALARP